MKYNLTLYEVFLETNPFNLIAISFIGILTILFTPEYCVAELKKRSLIFSFLIFLYSILLWQTHNSEISGFQNTIHINWKGLVNIYYSLGIDGITIFFVLLTTFITPFTLITSWINIQYLLKRFILLLLLIEFLLLNVFLTNDLFFFYFFFESILIPLFILIGTWGSRQRKIHAAYQFFFYTLVGSVLMLLAIILLYLKLGGSEISFLVSKMNELTANHFDSQITLYIFESQIFLFICFFLSLSIKIPMFPFHIWLPEAHVEAPTVGSVLLAGLLLKMGTYGILRFLLPLCTIGSVYFSPLVSLFSLLGIIYSSLTTIRQIDLKKIIAYSSVAHMNFVIIGLFSFNLIAYEGSLLLMISHGIVSSGLFLAIGLLYDRYKTRLLKYYGGLSQFMPIFSLFFLVFSLANISFPGTNNFVGEFLILSGVFSNNIVTTIFMATGMVFGAVYSIWLSNRLLFGPINENIKIFDDLNYREVLIFVPFLFLILYFGIYPFKLIHGSENDIIYLMKIIELTLNK